LKGIEKIALISYLSLKFHILPHLAYYLRTKYHDESYSDYPMISGVPVIFPRSGGASITMPVKVGDGCLIVFLDRDARS
jgi:hypothetical protein